MRAILLLIAALGAWAGEFSTFVGDGNEYHVSRAAADAAGNTILTGSRTLASGEAEIFVVRLDAAGKIALFTTLSGKGSDSATALAVDTAGNIYVAGSTTSRNFPLRNPLQSSAGPGFIVKWKADGSEREYSTYFPAAIQAMAVDAAGNVYVTGTTFAPTFPVTPGLPSGTVSMGVAGASGAFLTKISAAGDRIVYSALFVGHEKDCGAGSSCFLSIRATTGAAVAVDSAGAAYLTGNTDTSDLPATAGSFLAGGVGAFVAKVNAAGSGLVYLTYLSATHYPFAPFTNPANRATSIAVDATGAAYVAGATSDPKFPATRGAWQTAFAGPVDPAIPFPPPPTDGFVCKLQPDGRGVAWATYLGGRGDDAIAALALDAAGGVWVSGTSTSGADFPNAQGWMQGGDFVAGLSASGSSLPYAARFPDDSVRQSLAVDAAGIVHAVGSTGLVSAIPPQAAPAPRVVAVANAAAGPGGGRIAAGELISIYGPGIGSAAGVRVSIGGYAAPTVFISPSQINAAVPFAIAGQHTTSISISANGTSLADFPVGVDPARPEVFQRPDGYAAALNEDGSVNSADRPARNGSAVTIWITGADLSSYALADGQIAGAARDLECCRVRVFGVPAKVIYSGLAPGLLPAVTQINFRIPFLEFFAAQPWLEVTVESGGRTSRPVRIYSIQ